MSEALALPTEGVDTLPHNPATPVFLQILQDAYWLSTQATMPDGVQRGSTELEETIIQLGVYRIVLGVHQRVEAFDGNEWHSVHNERIARDILATLKSCLQPSESTWARGKRWLQTALGVSAELDPTLG